MNTTEIKTPKTLLEAVKYFADLEIAHQFFVGVRWPHGVICPTCGSTGAHYNPKYRRFQCNHNHDHRQFTVKTGTVMEDSPLGLDKWAAAFWLEVNAKNSISSCEVHRALGVTQKTAWFMLHRVRFALKRGSVEKMGRNGVPVEADETFIGGLAKFMHRKERERKITGGGQSGKAVVMGLLERHSSKKHSTVRATVLPNQPSKKDIAEVIHQNVAYGAHLMTDEHAAYRGLESDFEHQFINHAEKYVDGVIHTNGMENFWSLFKRCIKGTHVSVEPFHLLAYVDSEAFRFNNREVKDADRFNLAMRGFSGKRLTYKALIGKNDSESDTTSGKGAGSVNPAN